MSAAPSPASVPVPPRWRFRLTCVIAAAWLVALIVVAVTTSNPVAFNRRQIELADVIVMARVIDRAAGTVEVEASWKGEVPRGRITIQNLAASKPELTDTPLLIPLTPVGNGYVVTTVAPPGPGLLVYPATPKAREELDRLLKQLKQQHDTSPLPKGEREYLVIPVTHAAAVRVPHPRA